VQAHASAGLFLALLAFIRLDFVTFIGVLAGFGSLEFVIQAMAGLFI
jgi:hypothetical protein